MGELDKYPLCPAVCLGKGWAEVLQAKLGMPVDVRALCFTQSPWDGDDNCPFFCPSCYWAPVVSCCAVPRRADLESSGTCTGVSGSGRQGTRGRLSRLFPGMPQQSNSCTNLTSALYFLFPCVIFAAWCPGCSFPCMLSLCSRVLGMIGWSECRFVLPSMEWCHIPFTEAPADLCRCFCKWWWWSR